ncbi:LamG-like jellyroll fold domain-containing protein [Paenibacillus sp. PAMC21692]|uniref:LamG-like jellyroll fold domain-containing protein n=1 Tax=Paenibacillus sp. PAMC21692 TaxID=2762320 RepID=UPI00164DD472|nr:LamG-like jellyroll fold domain-containing protein [Paenibacillus sp. PAMC21692]QNK58325.1 family 43 glycosylhydrolase [Paenibacillus sp. PAMC21692]
MKENHVEQQAEQQAYLMGYFRSGPGQTHKVEQLHYAYSRDGRRWYELNGNKPVWAASVGEGILRDPFIGRGADGKWHMVYTIRPKGPSIGYAVSDDLIHWTDERVLPLMRNVPDTVNSWAPEFSCDAATGEYLVYWASSTGKDLSNSKHYAARTRDWMTFSPAELFFDPGFQTIDASIAEHGGRFYMAVKDESHVYEPARFPHAPMNFLAAADRLEGPYEPVPGFRTPDYTEAPEFLWIEREGKWLLLYDYWAYGKFGMMESTDMIRWSEELEESKTRIPYRARHATVFPISEGELRLLLERYALQARYPTTTYAPVRVSTWGSSGFQHDEFTLRTVALQIRPDSLQGTQVLYDEGDTENGLALRLRDGRLEGVVRSHGGQLIAAGEAGALSVGQWQHVALVFEEGQLRLYAGGAMVAEAKASFVMVRAHEHPGGYGGRFGQDAFGDSEGKAAFGGAIRDVRVYAVSLQAEDILAMIPEVLR